MRLRIHLFPLLPVSLIAAAALAISLVVSLSLVSPEASGTSQRVVAEVLILGPTCRHQVDVPHDGHLKYTIQVERTIKGHLPARRLNVEMPEALPAEGSMFGAWQRPDETIGHRALAVLPEGPSQLRSRLEEQLVEFSLDDGG